MCIKLVIWKSLYYDARSEKHQSRIRILPSAAHELKYLVFFSVLCFFSSLTYTKHIRTHYDITSIHKTAVHLSQCDRLTLAFVNLKFGLSLKTLKTGHSCSHLPRHIFVISHYISHNILYSKILIEFHVYENATYSEVYKDHCL